MQEFEEIIAKAVNAAFKHLLSEKHLYQTVEVDLSGIPQVSEKVRHKFVRPLTSTMRSGLPLTPPVSQVVNFGMQMANRFWQPLNPMQRGARTLTRTEPDYIEFELPTINTFCSGCNDSWPFNPTEALSIRASNQQQWFYLGYVCQQCKGLPIRFLVRRDFLKLRTAGRDPIEVLPTPKVLPKNLSKYYSDATVAHHAGQTLAGLFLLRVFIEQFWRTIPAVQKLVKQDSRATGDQQGDAYQSTLPKTFKDQFPSLKDAYGKLSAALHTADANPILFEEASSKIIEHFDARRLFKIL